MIQLVVDNNTGFDIYWIACKDDGSLFRCGVTPDGSQTRTGLNGPPETFTVEQDWLDRLEELELEDPRDQFNRE